MKPTGFLCALILPLLLASGQAIPGQEPVVRVTTEVVELQVVVINPNGKPVRGLTRQDFTLLVGDTPQKIDFFSEVELPSRQAAEAGTAGDRPEYPARTIMFFVDTLHLSLSRLAEVKQTLRQFVDGQLSEQDLVAIVDTARRVGITGQFTRNRHVLRYAVSQLGQGPQLRESLFTPYIAAGVERGEQRMIGLGARIMVMEGDTVFFEREHPDVATQIVRNRAQSILAETAYRREATLETLKAAATRMADLSGQRLMILCSDGFSLVNRNGTVDKTELRRAVSTAVRAGVVIHAMGGTELKPLPWARFGNLSPRVFETGAARGYLTSSQKDLEDGITTLAQETGGEAFLRTDNLGRALGKALGNSRFYYTVGFYSPEGDQRKDFQEFTLRIRDHPEYLARTQKGYFPVERVAPKEEYWNSTPERRFHKAVLDPLPVSGLQVFAWADFIETDADNAQVSLHVQIAGDNISMQKAGDTYRLGLELMAYVFNQKGKALESKIHRIEGKLQQDIVERICRNGLYLSRRLSLKAGLYQIRVGVRDKETEEIGTSMAWVEVPKLPTKRFLLSSLVLGDGLSNPGKFTDAKTDASRFKDGLRFYQKEDTFAYLVAVYPSEKAGPDSHLQIKTEFLLDGQPISESVFHPLRSRLLELGKKGALVGGQIALSGTSPGIYELIVSVKDPEENRSLQRMTAFGIR